MGQLGLKIQPVLSKWTSINIVSILQQAVQGWKWKPNSHGSTYFLFTRSCDPAHNSTQSHVYPSGLVSRPWFFSSPACHEIVGGGLVLASYIFIPQNRVISNKGLAETLLSFHCNLQLHITHFQVCFVYVIIIGTIIMVLKIILLIHKSKLITS